MPSAIKIEKVSKLREILKNAKAVYLLDFTGLNVPEITELRQKIKNKNALLRVVNNRLARIALEEEGLGELGEKLTGPNAFLIAYEDVVEPLKEAYEFLKEIKKGEIKGGILKGARAYSRDEIINLAKLPSLKELRAKTVQVLNTGIYSFIWHLKGIIFNFLIVLKKIEEKNKNL